MPRSRMIKPEFLTDSKLATITEGTRLFFIGLWIMSDDYGVVKGSPLLLKSLIYPLNTDITVEEVASRLQELVNLNILAPFKGDSEEYYFIRNFTKHQKVNHPSKQRNPEYPGDVDVEPFD